MDWVDSIRRAITYMEDNLTEQMTIGEIATHAYLSPYTFQKGFSMLCGYTVSEYLRQRRLAQAAAEVLTTDVKVVDLAVKYGYDSPDSFTKAFTRFHGATPSAVRRDGALVKSFAPLKIIFSLKGGIQMEYKIEKKDALTVLGVSKTFSYENAKEVVPKFWQEHFRNGGGKVVCGEFGINFDETMGGKEFEYLIADRYKGQPVPDGYVTKTIPAFTWAVFPCRGAMPDVMQEVNKKIFSEWLPNCEYDFAAGYCIEMYNNPMEYKMGTSDPNYYSEIWIPVKKK